MKTLMLPVIALALAGCNTTQQAPATVTVPVAPIDAKIAKVSQELARQCATAKVLLTLADVYATKPKVQLAVHSAQTTVDRFCARPPQNVNDAIALLAQVATELNNAINAAGTQTATTGGSI